jgi:hypothetical protein
MSRSVWFVAGAGVGVYAVARARRALEVFTADGLRDRLSGLAAGARVFREEVATGQQEKETQLREQLSLVPSGVPALQNPHTEDSNGEDSNGEDSNGEDSN